MDAERILHQVDFTTAKHLSSKTEAVTEQLRQDLTDERELLVEPAFQSPDKSDKEEPELGVSLAEAGPPPRTIPCSTPEESA